MRFLVILSILLPARAFSQSGEVSGDYIEGRSNHVFGCYCEWSAEAAMGGTEAILAWNFNEGAYGGVPLGGTAAAAVIVSETTLSMGSAPRRSVLFVDAEASEAQQRAVEALLRARYGRLLGEVLAVRTVPIRFTRESERAIMSAGDLARVVMRKAKLPQDALQGARLWYDPFVPLAEPTVATVLNLRYTGPEFDNRWDRNDTGTTGFYGQFRIAPE